MKAYEGAPSYANAYALTRYRIMKAVLVFLYREAHDISFVMLIINALLGLKNRKKRQFFNYFHHYLCQIHTSFEKKMYLCAIINIQEMERKRINRLKVVLAEKGMTNKQLAEILDKDPAVISKWVTNVAQPNVEMFIQLAKILEVSVDDLLWTED